MGQLTQEKIMRGWLVIVMLTIGAGWAGEPVKAEKKDGTKKEEAKKNPQVEAALSLIKAKQWEGAKTILEQVIKDDPKNIDATMALAQCEENLKNAGKATELYYKVIELVVADEALHESTDGKAIVEKCKKALVKLDEGAAIIRKHAEEMEKEAQALKGKNEFAYNQVMKVVWQLKGEPEKDRSSDKPKRKAGEIKLIDLTPTAAAVGWFENPTVNLFPGEPTRKPIINNKACDEFILACAASKLEYDLPENAKMFSAIGYSFVSKSVSFIVQCDGNIIYQSGSLETIKEGFARIEVKIPENAKKLALIVDPLGSTNSDYSTWCYPRIK